MRANKQDLPHLSPPLPTRESKERGNRKRFPIRRRGRIFYFLSPPFPSGKEGEIKREGMGDKRFPSPTLILPLQRRGRKPACQPACQPACRQTSRQVEGRRNITCQNVPYL